MLTLGNQKNVLKLDVARIKIAKIPPVALADIMRDLDIFEQLSLFRTLPFDVQLKVFADMTFDAPQGWKVKVVPSQRQGRFLPSTP